MDNSPLQITKKDNQVKFNPEKEGPLFQVMITLMLILAFAVCFTAINM